MAHLLQARNSGVVAEVKIRFDKSQYQFNVDVQKWDEKTSSTVKVGQRNFPLPSSLWGGYSIGHFKTQLGNTLPPVTAGAEFSGENVSDDKKISELAPVTAEQGQDFFLVFNVDKSAPSASGRAESAGGGLARAQSVQIKAGTGPISGDRELITDVSLYLDSGTYYVTVTAKNGPQGVTFEGKWSVSENYLSSTSVKELKSKLPGFPKTSDRGTLKTGASSKNIKDSDKMGPLGIKGKKGDRVSFQFTFELAAIGGASDVPTPSVSAEAFEAAPEIEAKWRYHISVGVSLMEGNVFIVFDGKSEPDREGGALPEARKSAALPKMTFTVFKLNDMLNILKGGLWPVFEPGWAVLKRGPNKERVKVNGSVSMEKAGIFCPPQGSSQYEFELKIDANHTLPTA